ncbi:MAG: spore coat associated protein CotJA [Oscillospiraceae bacterium]
MDEYSIDLKQPVSLAMAYVKWQTFGDVYDPQLAFTRGTIFPALDLPFIGEEAVPRG